MTTFDRITSDPAQLNGQPCIRNLRLTVRRVLEALAVHPNRIELHTEYPELDDEDIRQALEYAAAIRNFQCNNESPKRLAIQYLNTDLDLVASRDLKPLTSALEKRGVRPLNVEQAGDGQWYSILEVEHEVEPHEPEATIRVMLDAIEAIDGEAEELWAGCSKREFNIGYDCGDEPWAFNDGLTNSTLKRMASANTSLRITIYPAAPPHKTNDAE